MTSLNLLISYPYLRMHRQYTKLHFLIYHTNDNKTNNKNKDKYKDKDKDNILYYKLYR